MIVIVWSVVYCSSLHNFAICSIEYFCYLAGLIVGLVLLTWAIGRFVVQRAEVSTLDWTGKGFLRYPIIALVAGFLGGLLGLGGGVVMSPVLLELGMHAEAVQATTAMFVLISSSLASVQFGLQGRYESPMYVAWFCGIALLGTLAGQWFCEVVIRRYKRFSMITFAIVLILSGSFLALIIIGAQQVYEEYYSNSPTAFQFQWHKVCGSHDGIMVPVEPAPFERFGVWKAHNKVPVLGVH